MSKPFFVSLPNRALIEIEGADRYDFLQGLVTNDITPLMEDNAPAHLAVYACLLSPQGKFLHDFFITNGAGGSIFLECENGGEDENGKSGARVQDLLARLNKYRLRAALTISAEEDVPVYAVMDSDEHDVPPPFIRDPRHKALGFRTLTKPVNIEERPFAEWDKRRIMRGIPDGSRDMKVDSATMLESRMDVFHGVSFDKGCYVGQEVTARTHHRGLVKKHLRPVRFTKDAPPAPFTDLRAPDDTLLGEMRSSCGDVGMALIKEEATDNLSSLNIGLLT